MTSLKSSTGTEIPIFNTYLSITESLDFNKILVRYREFVF